MDQGQSLQTETGAVLYSASAGGFYLPGVHSVIPADAVEITADEHRALLAGQGNGQRIAAGADGKPTLVDAAPIVPSLVTMRQARLALLAAGRLQDVNTALAEMPGNDGEAARIEWEYATTVERDSALVAGLAAALDLDADQLDQLFSDAAAR
jgi:hypothetical protein